LRLGDSENAFEAIDKSIQKLKKAVENEEKPLLFNEFGTILFQMIKLSLVLQINAENSLTNATNKFINRLIDVLPPMEGNDYNLCDITAPEQDKLWQ
jgi:tetrapyrrole methylase family protein/MazG family protein